MRGWFGSVSPYQKGGEKRANTSDNETAHNCMKHDVASVS